MQPRIGLFIVLTLTSGGSSWPLPIGLTGPHSHTHQSEPWLTAVASDGAECGTREHNVSIIRARQGTTINGCARRGGVVNQWIQINVL